MQFRSIPPINPRYWVAITLASVFGANMGDFIARDLHLGHIRGVPVLAAILVAIVVAERVGRRGSELWYWLAIVTLRTAATNLGDLATHDGKLGEMQVSLGLAVLLAVVLIIRRIATPEPDTSGVPRTDAGYWLAMLVAGTFGTTFGDGLGGALGLPTSMLVTAVAVLAILGLRLRQGMPFAAEYWVAIAAIRTFGTNAGDMSAHTIGLSPSTLISGLALLTVLVLWPKRVAAASAA